MIKMKLRKCLLLTLSCVVCISGCQSGTGQLITEENALKQTHEVKIKPLGKHKNEPMIYGMGSTSKVFTAAAVMKLAEQGLVDLDLPLIEYIPDFYMDDWRYQAITPRMLINHSSGLQGSSLANTLLYGDPDSYHHDTLLIQLRTQRLKANPGEFTVYCNDGFTLAEILVERISNQSFTTYLEENFWRPMGLDNFRTAQSIKNHDSMVPVYYQNKIKLPDEFANVIGSGGMYATAENLSQAGQMFVTNPARPFQILLPETVFEMGESWFTKGYGVDPEIPSNMGYGLGWDSVASPIFQKYGIRALSKGGDTNNYHSMLTVLPDLNISCAVVSSGGSSSYNALIAEDIIAIYLEEAGQLKKEDLSLSSAVAVTKKIPQDIFEYAGWYVGSGIYQVAFSGAEELILSSHGTRRDTEQVYRYIGDNRFISATGGYINGSGQLVEAEKGTHGVTTLTFQAEQDGVYLGIVTEETIPELGERVINIPIAERAGAHPITADMETLWKARVGKEYYLVNEKYTSANYLRYPVVKPIMYEGFSGYLGEEEGSFIAKITTASEAEFFQKLPGQFGRDLIDVSFYQRNGKEYINSRYHYLCIDALAEYTSELSEVTMDQQGEAAWYRIGSEWIDKTVIIEAPENGHFYIYTYIEDKLTCIASSLLGDSNTALHLPQGGRIAFTGEAGAQFKIQSGR